MEMWKVILVFGIIAIIFDGVWATISRARNYTYSKGMWVSFLIYTIAGVVASNNGNFLDGIISGAVVAGIEATIGWWVSWVIGPGRFPDSISKNTYPKLIANAIARVILTGALFGLLGSIITLVV